MKSMNKILVKLFRSPGSITKKVVESEVRRLRSAISDAQLMTASENALVRRRFLKLSSQDWSSAILDEIEKRYI